MAEEKTIELNDALSTQCQNPKNVTIYNNDLYIACFDDYGQVNHGAIVKVDPSNNVSVLNLNKCGAVRVNSTKNHVYVGADDKSTPLMDYIVKIFELNTENFTLDENNEVDTSGYRIFDFKVFNNKIFATAERDGKYYILVADEDFRIEKSINIFKNFNYPRILYYNT